MLFPENYNKACKPDIQVGDDAHIVPKKTLALPLLLRRGARCAHRAERSKQHTSKGRVAKLHLGTIEFVGALIKRPRADNIRPYGHKTWIPA